MIIYKAIKNKLLNSLSNAYAPVTGKLVACVIETDKGIYSGFNEETTGKFPFIHAESNAVKEVMQFENNPRIKNIYMTGAGNINRAKQIVPCLACHNLLEHYATTCTTVHILIRENKEDKITSFPFTNLSKSYQKRKPSILKGRTRPEIVKELENCTHLRNDEANIISEIRLLGLQDKVSFYLTGSSAKRGGTSEPILIAENKLYNDIDLIATGDKPKHIEAMIESLLKKYYGDFQKINRDIPTSWPWYKVQAKYYYNVEKNDDKLVFDLTVARKFDEAWSDLSYVENNWFHKLS